MLETGIYFVQYLIAFAIVNMLLPRILFGHSDRTGLSRFFAGFILMTLVVILMGYVLVLLKLFETITILVVFLLVALGRTFFIKSKKSRKTLFKEITLWIYDYSDGIINLPKLLKKRLSDRKKKIRESMVSLDKTSILNLIVVSSLFLYSLYLRLADAFLHAAPAMSDSYVTLAWIKYIGKNALFHDGIYPQGFHIYQAVLHNFAGTDALYILKFTGPINGALIALGIYFAVSSFLKSKPAGIIAASVYGLFGIFLAAGWERQAATNSQEFAFVFIMPCLYFFYKYYMEKDKQDLLVAGAALTVIGLIHTLAFVYAALGIAILFVFFLFSHRGEMKRRQILGVIGVSLLSSVISLIPFGIGLLLGKRFHGSSVEFALGQSTYITYPILGFMDCAVLAGLALLALSILFSIRKPFVSARVFLLLFGTAAFCLYYFGGVLTNSVLVASRSNDVYALAAPMVIGGGFYCLVLAFTRWKHSEFIISLLCLALVAGAAVVWKPVPIVPYKMEYDSCVEQYLRISKNFRATEWLIVSQEEGYALVLGKGWHLMVQDFLKDYDPAAGTLKINTPHVLIYIEKNIYPTYMRMSSLATIYQRRLEESTDMQQWMATYIKTNGKQEIYFEDDNIVIYHIYEASAQSALTDKVLGPGS